VTDAFKALEPCERDLTGGEELLYRQVPAFNWDPQSGKPVSHAFGPSTADKGMASHARSSVVSASDSRAWHNENVKSESKGVWAISIQEVTDQGTRAVDDCACPSPPGSSERSPGHCYVDYRHMEKREQRLVRAMLYAKAIKRGEIPS
jgi:hypothetical protein